MVARVAGVVAKPIHGIWMAIRSRPKTFGGVALGVFLLDVLLPPVVLSLVRTPWDYFSFNPWLKQLPDYLASSEIPFQEKLAFLPRLALFWFIANDRYGFPEWGFTVDVRDLLRFVLTAVLFGAYFALWFSHRDHVQQCGVGARASRNTGAAGALASVLGLSTGPCSVVGCGAPVLPVVGLIFVGLSSDTLRMLTQFSSMITALLLVALTVAVVALGWRLGAPSGLHSPSHS